MQNYRRSSQPVLNQLCDFGFKGLQVRALPGADPLPERISGRLRQSE
jgi:hypothetical protein